MKKKQIIYISGYGRSGSTILDLILAKTFKIKTLGEYSNIYSSQIQIENLCKCGGGPNCDYSILHHNSNIEQFRLNRKYFIWNESILKIFNLVNWGKKRYKLLNEDLYNRFNQEDVLIDSSNNSYLIGYRPINLSEIFDMRIIWLVRNPINVVSSKFKGNNKKLKEGSLNDFKGALIAVFSWHISNRIMLNFSKKNQVPVIKINYEDFQKNPEQVISGIEEFLNRKSVEEFSLKTNFATPHFIAGNRLVKMDTVTFKPDIDGHPIKIPKTLAITNKIVNGRLYKKINAYQ
jgi:hypothetical protein